MVGFGPHRHLWAIVALAANAVGRKTRCHAGRVRPETTTFAAAADALAVAAARHARAARAASRTTPLESWMPGGPRAVRRLAPHRWELCLHNPVRLLQEVSAALARAARPRRSGLPRAARRRMRSSAAGRHGSAASAAGPVDAESPVAYFCAEYGVHRSLPVYSGGLGALAGDIAQGARRTARCRWSAVGLMYHQGYFRQRIERSGLAAGVLGRHRSRSLPGALVTGDDGTPLTVTVPIHGEDVVAQIWRVAVGRVPLYLLDAERPENPRVARWISSQLYVGDPYTRLGQYVLSGVGGCARCARWGSSPASCISTRVTLHSCRSSSTTPTAPCSRRTRRCRRATTPTGPDEVREALSGLGVDIDEIVRLGRTRPRRSERAVRRHAVRAARQAARRTASAARHGEVAREMWHALWPERPVDDVPIGHVTNGVHMPTWIGAPMRELLDGRLGEGWLDRAADPATWEPRRRHPRRGAVGGARPPARRARRLRARAQRGRTGSSPRRGPRLRRGGGARVRPRAC